MEKYDIVLGFDYGEKRIGIAVGNSLTQTAQPIGILTTLHAQPNWSAIAQLIETWRPTHCVVGLPQTADGTETEWILRVKKFARRLHGRFALPVILVDEQLSSKQAQEYVKKGQHVDAVAAAIIVTRYWQLPLSAHTLCGSSPS